MVVHCKERAFPSTLGSEEEENPSKLGRGEGMLNWGKEEDSWLREGEAKKCFLKEAQANGPVRDSDGGERGGFPEDERWV